MSSVSAAGFSCQKYYPPVDDKQELGPGGIPLPAPISCEDEKKIGGDQYHCCLLKQNYITRERMRIMTYEQTLAIFDQGISTISAADPASPSGRFLSERLPLARNHSLVDAAEKSFDMYYFRHGDRRYLETGQRCLETALANPITSYGRDISPRRMFDLSVATPIQPVEKEFDAKLLLIQILNILEPRRAIQLTKETGACLSDFDCYDPRGQNNISIQGYRNRLDIMRANMGIYNFAWEDTAASLEAAQRACQSSAKMSEDNFGISFRIPWFALHGLNLKDIKYNVLEALIYIGRLEMHRNIKQYPAARKSFLTALSYPEATRKYGGFLDIGLKSIYYLLLIAVKTTDPRTETLADAARKFNADLDPLWPRLVSKEGEDFREALGLLIRRQSLTDHFSDAIQSGADSWANRPVRLPNADWSGLRGNLGLWFNLPSIIPQDNSPIESAFDLDRVTTPLERLELFMELINYVEIPFDLKAEVIKYYERLNPAL